MKDMLTTDSTDEVDGTFRLMLSIFAVENETEGLKDEVKKWSWPRQQ